MFSNLFFGMLIALGASLILLSCGVNLGAEGGIGIGMISAVTGIVLGEIVDSLR